MQTGYSQTAMRECRMKEYNADKIAYEEHICCPKCGQPLTLNFNISMMNGKLYVWFEGPCKDCLDTIVDLMPVLTDMPEENRRMLWRILSN